MQRPARGSQSQHLRIFLLMQEVEGRLYGSATGDSEHSTLWGSSFVTGRTALRGFSCCLQPFFFRAFRKAAYPPPALHASHMPTLPRAKLRAFESKDAKFLDRSGSCFPSPVPIFSPSAKNLASGFRKTRKGEGYARRSARKRRNPEE